MLASWEMSAQWVQTNGPGGGIIHALATDGTTHYAGTFGNGVYRSGNNGVSWTRCSNGLSDLYIYALAIRDNKFFAGTFRHGIFLSTDSGDSWIEVNNGLTSLDIRALALNETTVFAGTLKGVFVSTNYESS